MKTKIITRTVLLLSIVSFFGDISSELLYPIMPLYLKSIGMGALFIGMLEGLADAISGISKSYFGKLSDVSGRRMPFVWFGYVLSSFSKAAIGLFANPVWVLFTRSADRLGKGVRTASRDAMLSAEATPETKGAVFGFHRSLDTFGAFVGPILALVYLNYHPGEYRKLFMFALIPAFFVVFSLIFVKEKKIEKKIEKGNLFFSSLTYWKIATLDYKRIISLILLFTLVNSSDMFLLLKARESGLNDVQTISLYIFYNLIYAISSYQMGMLSDRIGKKKVFLMGLVFFVITYAGMAFNTRVDVFYLLFFFYGLFAASTEGITKAWVSNLCEKVDLATALGFQSTTQSLAAMLASFIAGLIWYSFGSQYVFMLASFVTFIIAILLIREKRIA
ncbi:MAG: MFS transporter [Bacteriovorax sp.]|nr:MFS transporter [Bacteriovorax sp.]